uniref:ATP synthase F0 subunit 8 n=1 Tax=Tuxedo drakei TaxID=981287 RepID=A0A514LQ26_9HEMI|nr:ATP synthase F0 subunit 8 [Tuxedo drakei]
MPQMSPMWWSTLFLIFLSTYLMIMMNMYTYNIYQKWNKESIKKKETSNINWKW